MAEWRERGYVPDSDDEDDDASQPSRTAPFVASSRPASNTGERVTPYDNEDQATEISLSPDPKEQNTETSVQRLNDTPDGFKDKNERYGGSQTVQSPNHQVGAAYQPPLSSLDLLQTQLALGTQTVREVLGGHFQPNFSSSLDSSPLSSIHSSLSDPISLTSPAQDSVHSERPAHSQERHAQDDNSELAVVLANGRTLRHRNPIQQNPYTLEAAKYQQSLRARGLRPVQLFASDRIETSNEHSAESQELPWSQHELPNSPQSYLQRRASLKDGDVSSGKEGAKTALRSGSADAEERSSHDQPQLARKRRKLFHSKHLRDPSFRRDYDTIFDFPGEDQDLNGPFQDDGDMDRDDHESNDMVTTTPTKHLEYRRGGFVSEDGFRFPPELSPSRAFPAQSAERPSHANSPIRIDDDSSDEDVGDNRGVSSPSPVSSSDVNEDDSQRVLKFQRRIKGVLPASWLRLDNLKPTQPSRRSHLTARLPQEGSEAKGVAHKTSKARDKPLHANDLFNALLSDDDDGQSNRSSQAPSRDTYLHQSRLDYGGLLNDHYDEVHEEDTVDTMAPKSPRSRTRTDSHGFHRRKQSLTPYQSSKRKGVSNNRSHSTSNGQVKVSNQVNRSVQQPLMRRPLPSYVGILDAEDVTGRPRSQQPDFLKIAARQARLRSDLGRRKPGNKTLQLASKKETRQANKVLQQWRDGDIARANPRKLQRKMSSTNRLPLQERPSNARVDASIHHKETLLSTEVSHPTDRLILKVLAREQARNSEVGGAAQTPPTNNNTKQLDQETAAPKPPSRRRLGAGNLISRLQQKNAMRDAQVEGEGVRSSRRVRPNYFTAALASLNRQSKRDPDRQDTRIDMERTQGDTSTDERKTAPIPAKRPDAQARSKRPRKRTPRRRLLLASSDVPTKIAPVLQRQPSIHHFMQEIPPYPMDFGLSLLGEHIHLGKTTFVGSGQFSRCLSLSTYDDNVDNEDSLYLEESCWAGSPLVQIILKAFWRFRKVLRVHVPQESSVNSSSADTLKDCALTLSVLDSLLGLVRIESIQDLPMETYQSIPSSALEASMEVRRLNLDLTDLTRISVRLTVLAYKGYALCLKSKSEIWLDSVTDAYEKMLVLLASLVLQSTTLQRLQAQFLKILCKSISIDNGIDAVDLEAIIVLRHLLDTAPLPSRWSNFWDIYNHCYAGSIEVSPDSNDLERNWQDVFTGTVAMSFSVQGHVDPAQRSDSKSANWLRVKDLLDHSQASFDPNGRVRHSPLFYLRAVYQRCFVLIQKFHWGEREVILDTLYDLFRRHNFECPVEEQYDYPDFLDNLTESTAIQIQKNNSSFQCLLKLIALVVKEMAKQGEHDPQTKRRLKNLLFRLIPNNGHVSSKYEEIEEYRLTPLKNHHDLLTTLYWASPVQYRPRLQRFQDLVDFSKSHLGACRVSLKAWTRLARFQISASEPLSSITPLVEMLSIMVQTMVKQHRSAAQEVQAHRARWSSEHVESVVKYNKTQMESFLCEVVEALDSVLKSCRDDANAVYILQEDVLTSMTALFSTRSTHCDKLFVQIFKLVQSMVQRNVKDTRAPEDPLVLDNEITQAPNEDSQEFGDWSHFEALVDQPALEALQYVNSSLFPTLSRLIGDIIGADMAPAPEILEEILWSWSSIIQALASQGLRDAGNFISSHHRESWSWLASTPQKRRYYPLFATQLIDKIGSMFYQENRAPILESYAIALCQPESFQEWLPQFTTSILAQNEPLIQTAFPAKLTEAKPARILSIMMLNLRAARPSNGLDSLSREVVGALLGSMKTNYQELDSAADYEKRDEYVIFVQHVLNELSIYLPGYRKLEPFFNDSSLFPQSASSIYISLRQYSLTITNGSNQKPLITFFYNILERAALEDSQLILQEQLITTLHDLETEAAGLDDNPPQLQAFLLQSLFPAYVEVMCTEQGRCLVGPVLTAIQRIYCNATPYVTNLSVSGSIVFRPQRRFLVEQWRDTSWITSFLTSTKCLLASFQHVLRALSLDGTDLDRQPHVVEDLYLLITTLSTILGPVNMVQQFEEVGLSASTRDTLYLIFRSLQCFDDFIRNIETLVMQKEDMKLEVNSLPEIWPNLSNSSDPMYMFAQSELVAVFRSSWTLDSGSGIHVIKHQGPKEILSAKRRDEELREEIEQTGVEWARWTMWSACRVWRDEWSKVDDQDQAEGSNTEIDEENWRLFVL